MSDEPSPDCGILHPERIEEATVLRAQRRADEARRVAAEATAEARRAAHARDLAEVRRHLDEERELRERQRQQVLAEQAHKEAERARQEVERALLVEAPVTASPTNETVRDPRANASQARRAARARLEDEAARVAAARAALDAEDALEADGEAANQGELAALEAERAAAAEREAANQGELAALEAERLAEAEQHRVLAEAMQRELEEIDQRLEARAQSKSTVSGAVVARVVQRKSRLRVSASVLIDHSGTLVALPLINISLTGALISTGGQSLPSLRVGLILLITVCAIEDVSRQVDLVARVVRLTEKDAALDWTEDRAAAYDLARLLDELSSGGAG